MDVDSAARELNLPRHDMQFTEKLSVKEFGAVARVTEKIAGVLRGKLIDVLVECPSEQEVSVDGGRVVIKVGQQQQQQREKGGGSGDGAGGTKEVAVTWSIDVRIDDIEIK